MNRLAIALGILFLPIGLARAEDWTRFRGPNGTGVADPTTPTEFDLKQNLAWKHKFEGELGHGSPIVVGDKVILQTASTNNKRRSILCLNANTGKVEWQEFAKVSEGKVHKKNNLASSTPCSDGERVFNVYWEGTSLGLEAWTLKGERLWSKDLGSYASEHGAGHSPMVHDGIVFVNFDQDGAAELLAFDAKTGEKKWIEKREAHRASYTVPFILETKGKADQLIVGSTKTVDSYDPKTGKSSWSYTLQWPTQKPLRAIGQPILAAGNIVTYTGEGGAGRYMVSVKTDGKGDTTKDGLAWELKKNTPYVPGAVVSNDHLYWLNDDGVAGCADAKTGALKWNERALAKGISASLLLVGERIFAIGEDGKAVSFPADLSKLGELKKSDLGEPVFATPAAANGKLYLRGGTHLFAIQKKGS